MDEDLIDSRIRMRQLIETGKIQDAIAEIDSVN